MTLVHYGVDVALKRQDDLDKKAIAEVDSFISRAKKVAVIDIGCAAGGTTVALAQPGASVVGIDIKDYSHEFSVLRTRYNLSEHQLRFIHDDVSNLLSYIDNLSAHICLLQRTIHYLPYSDAMLLLTHLRDSGVFSLFISASGIESDIGRNYSHRDKTIEHRFCSLTEEDAEIFSINQPLCLYTPEEFMVLLQESGWMIEECWVSAFGNIKAVCS